MALGMYVVGVLLEPMIVLSKNMEKSERVERSANSAWGIRRAINTFFFHPWIYWGINIGVSDLVKWDWRLKLCVYVAADFDCFS